MNTINRVFLAVIIVAMLAACGTTKVALNPETTANINSIALIRVTEPETYTGGDFGNAGMAFGAIGAAVAGSSSAKAGKSINQIAIDKGVKAGERLTQALANKLTDNGYNVTLTTASREKPTKLLSNYSTVDLNGAGAVLDVVIESIGYATEHPITSPFWRPSSQIRVALVDSKSRKVIYSEKFMYGYHNPFMSGTDIDAPEQFRFKSKEALFSDADKLAEGLIISIDAVTKEVAENLSK